MNLQTAIAQTQQAAAKELRSTLKVPQPPDPSPQEMQWLERFRQYALSKGVSPFPAQPVAIAGFVRDVVADDKVLEFLKALEIQHARFDLPNPVHTYVVAAVLEDKLKLDPPRDWNAQDRLVWATLDPIVREIIIRREAERNKALRHSFNKLAEERKKLEAELDKQKEVKSDELQ